MLKSVYYCHLTAKLVGLSKHNKLNEQGIVGIVVDSQIQVL